MSCFLCSNTHTAVVAMLAHAPGIVSIEQLRETARTLRALNDASLKARYDKSPSPMSGAELCAAFLSAGKWIRNATPADMLKAAQCFEHQSDNAPSNYPGQSILRDVIARVSAMRGADRPSAVWSI